MSGFWLLILTLSCVLTEAFFSMFEMACVSFNKVRLQYYESQKNRRAVWLKLLLSKPSRLFGTCLIAIEAALQLGSEASRRFYETLHWNPDFSPISQILLVLIFGELAPLFAARKHAEQVALNSIGVVYFLSKIFSPLTWLLDCCAKFIDILFKKGSVSHLYLSREEIQRAFEEQDIKIMRSEREKMSLVVSHVLSLKDRKVKELMVPLNTLPLFPQEMSLGESMQLLKKSYSPFLLLYNRSKENISLIVAVQDLIRGNLASPLSMYGRSLQFLTEESSLFPFLKQFRKGGVAIVLNSSGKAVGLIALDQVLEMIFGGKELTGQPIQEQFFIEKSFSGDLLICEFNKEFHAHLFCHGAETLSDLVTQVLQHPPSEGEILHVDSFEIIVQEVSLRGAKTLTIRSLI
jgi:CBS domain containing-hemolysin-like protein